MKKDIHPKYFDDAKVVCACGNTFTTGSTVEQIRVELCSTCHPFYTGQMKYVDTLGRVEKFKKAQKAAQAVRSQLDEKKKAKEDRRKKQQEAPKTLREMLLGK